MDLSWDSFLLAAAKDGDKGWIVSEHETAAYGYGRTLLEAMADFWHALQWLSDVAEGRELAPHLQRQVSRARWMLEVHGG